MSDEQYQRDCLTVINEMWQALKPRIVSVNKSEAYWADVMETFNGISQKYTGTETEALAKRLCIACVSTLEDKYRELFGGGI